LLLAAARLFHILRAIPGSRDWNSVESSNRFEERMKQLLSPDYRPSETEPFMNPMQQEYFRQKLLAWKSELLKESSETLNHLQEESLSEPDIADRASLETDRALELRTRDRERKLISKIDEALIRIEDGTYGYCEETGEPIGIKRLEARPIATLSIEAQERHERMERTHRDD
jgi:DnaK suppressor protein